MLKDSKGDRRAFEASDLRYVLIELAGYGQQHGFSENVRRRMTDLGFEPYRYDPFTRDLELEPLGNERQIKVENILFLRGIEFVKRRVESGAAFTVGDWKI
jgi:hypothetical protein